MISKKKLEKIILDCYQELYENSTPKGDFKQILENAKFNEMGEKIIPYNDYELDKTVYENIINKYVKKYKMDDYTHSVFNFRIYLGCGPKYKINEPI
jgi:hypothetical protein